MRRQSEAAGRNPFTVMMQPCWLLHWQLFSAVVPFLGFCSESVSSGAVEVELTCDTAAVFVVFCFFCNSFFFCLLRNGPPAKSHRQVRINPCMSFPSPSFVCELSDDFGNVSFGQMCSFSTSQSISGLSSERVCVCFFPLPCLCVCDTPTQPVQLLTPLQPSNIRLIDLAICNALENVCGFQVDSGATLQTHTDIQQSFEESTSFSYCKDIEINAAQ